MPNVSIADWRCPHCHVSYSVTATNRTLSLAHCRQLVELADRHVIECGIESDPNPSSSTGGGLLGAAPATQNAAASGSRSFTLHNGRLHDLEVLMMTTGEHVRVATMLDPVAIVVPQDWKYFDNTVVWGAPVVTGQVDVPVLAYGAIDPVAKRVVSREIKVDLYRGSEVVLVGTPAELSSDGKRLVVRAPVAGYGLAFDAVHPAGSPHNELFLSNQVVEVPAGQACTLEVSVS